MCSKEQGYYLVGSDKYKNYKAKRGIEGEVVGHVADTKPPEDNALYQSWDGGETWEMTGEWQWRANRWVLVRCDHGDLMQGGRGE
jgi:hypothetical protein